MKNILIFFTSLLIISVHQSYSQELKKKRKKEGYYIEEYHVLKRNKKIKHGSFIKYSLNSFDKKTIHAIGEYDQGQKSGNWYFFQMNGYLFKEGQFAQDQKQGLWIEYYPPKQKNSNTLKIINESIYEVNHGVEITQEGKVLIDRSKITKSAEGVYRKGEKIGSWNYYGFNDSLVHKYDHSNSVLVKSNPNGSPCPYLGGCKRFYRNFETEKITAPKYDTYFTINISSDLAPDDFIVSDFSGDTLLVSQVKSALEPLASDILYDENKETVLNVKYLKKPEMFSDKFQIDFGYIPIEESPKD